MVVEAVMAEVNSASSIESGMDWRSCCEATLGVQSGWMIPVSGLYRNFCDACTVSLLEQGMTVSGAGACGEGSKVAQYGSTAADEATKIGTFRLTSMGPVLLAVELTGTR